MQYLYLLNKETGEIEELEGEVRPGRVSCSSTPHVQSVFVTTENKRYGVRKLGQVYRNVLWLEKPCLSMARQLFLVDILNEANEHYEKYARSMDLSKKIDRGKES